MLRKTEAYQCPNGVWETNIERAVARHLVELVSGREGPELSFSAALAIVKSREQVIALLHELP